MAQLLNQEELVQMYYRLQCGHFVSCLEIEQRSFRVRDFHKALVLANQRYHRRPRIERQAT